MHSRGPSILLSLAAAAAAKSLKSRLTLCDSKAAHQAPPSLGFSRQGHWSGLPFPSPVGLLAVFYCSVSKSCLTLLNPMNCSTPGFPVPHHLPEFAQVRVQWIGDAIQPSHPLPSSSPFVFSLSHHQGLFQGVSMCHIKADVVRSMHSA